MLPYTLILLLCASFVYSAPTAQNNGDKIHIPEKCEDVLAVKVCQNISDIAKNLKIKSAEVTEVIKDAVKNGKTKAEDIYKSVQETLQKKVLSKKCEDLTSASTCANLRALASSLKIKAEKVEEYVIKALIQGKNSANELVDQVIDYYKREIKTKSCEDFLTKSQCDKIEDVSNTLKLKTDQWKDAFINGLIKAKKDGTEVLTETFNNIKEFTKNTKCEDILNPNVCATLRKYAEATKIGFPKVMDAAINAIIKGYKLGKGLIKAIYDITDYFYDCEDVFDQSSCDRLKKMVSYLGVKATEIDAIVRKYVRKGIDLGSSLYDKIVKYLKEKVLCKINVFCDDDKDDDITKRSTLDDDEDNLVAKIKEALKKKLPQLNQHIRDLLAKAVLKTKEIRTELKKVFEKIAASGKAKYETLKKIIKDILSENKDQKVNHALVRRDIYEDMKAALLHASGKMKEALQKFLSMSKEHLKKIKSVVYDIIQKVMGEKEAKQHLDELDKMVDETVENEMRILMKSAEDEIENVLLTNDD